MRNLKKILIIMILIPSSLLSAGDYSSGKEKSQIVQLVMVLMEYHRLRLSYTCWST